MVDIVTFDNIDETSKKMVAWNHLNKGKKLKLAKILRKLAVLIEIIEEAQRITDDEHFEIEE